MIVKLNTTPAPVPSKAGNGIIVFVGIVIAAAIAYYVYDRYYKKKPEEKQDET